MIEGSPSVLLVGGDEVARGEISVDAGLSLSVRIDEIVGDLPGPGDGAVLRTFEPVSGRREYAVTVESLTPNTIVVTHVELVSAYQQRAIGRVSTEVPVVLLYEMDGDEIRDAGTPIAATIVDLSATGLRLFSSVPLDDGYRFGFLFSTDVDDFTLVAESLRREVVPQGYLHGCRLVGTSQREADALHTFVLTEQIVRRRDPEPG